MKNFTVFLFCALCYLHLSAQNLYTYSIGTLQGQPQPLSTYSGKKVLLVVLPHRAADTSLLSPTALVAVQSRYADSLIIIGVPATDAGYQLQDSALLRALYSFSTPSFVYGAPMKVKKTSGSNQEPLFQWLTQVGKNGHFDNDVQSVGYKFFVNEAGNLNAVLGPQIRLDNPAIDRILQRIAPH